MACFVWRIIQTALDFHFSPNSFENLFVLGLTVLIAKKRTWFCLVVKRSSGQFGALEMIVVLVIS
jgi:hypothetical protein